MSEDGAYNHLQYLFLANIKAPQAYHLRYEI